MLAAAFPSAGKSTGRKHRGKWISGEISWEKAGGELDQGRAKARQQAQAAAPQQQHAELSLWMCSRSHLQSHAGQGRFVSSSSSSHWLLLAMAVAGLTHMPVVPAAHCFYCTAIIFAGLCGPCLLCLVFASGSLQVPRTGGHLREPRGLSGSETGAEEGLPAHQKVSITFFPLKITGKTGTGIQKAIGAATASGKSHENPLDVDK